MPSKTVPTIQVDNVCAHGADIPICRQREVNPAPRWSRAEKGFVILLGVALLVLLYANLGGYRTLSAHEAYVAVTAREMIENGDWVVPTYGGVPRLCKPPWSYWVAAAFGWLGGGITEFTARLPSTLAAIGLVVLMGVWATRWYGRTAGLCALFIQATSYYFLNFGRDATVDMQLCFVMTLALFLCSPHVPQEGNRWRWLCIWGLLGISWMMKLIYGPVLVVAVLLAYWAVQGQLRNALTPVHLVGLLVFAVIALPWTVALLWRMSEALEVWRHETLGRALGEMDSKPWWYFLVLVIWLPLPWTPLVLLRLREHWRLAWKEGDPRERFLSVWFLAQVILISLSVDKQTSYILPALPVLTLLAAPRLAQWVDTRKTWNFLSLRRAAIVGLTAFVLGFVGIAFWLLPGRDSRRPEVELARALVPLADGRDSIAFGLGQHPVVFYSKARRIEAPADLNRELESGPGLQLLTHVAHLPFLKTLGSVEALAEIDAHHPAYSKRTDPLVLVRLRRN
ncbi:MAG: glycosyltransferase family 39 protein [Gemmataceae bacterium]|nr:glycosyltransferase family 39 protein [Gemmataceae bacterium]MCI0739596.1 glycosyltransferase family 39 protein [Gemmataceae bacterium]